MDCTASLQVSHDLGVCRNYVSTSQFKNMVGRRRLHLRKTSFSSYGSQLDALSLRLSASVCRPICHIHSGYNVFKCRSSLIPGNVNEIPILKTAVTAVMRSYKLYHGSPLLLKLVPAVSVIVFAVWGLGPLMHHSRNLFLHRSDSSWKKSNTHYIMTSYVQPLMLWMGAALVCRALDPVILPSEASQIVKQRLLNFIRSLSTVLAFAFCLSSLIQQTQKFFMEAHDSNDTRNMGFQFAGKAVYTAVWVAAVSLFMELLGFSTQKWLTAGGLGTVLLTLAGREIFTNFLSSAMIHATRPFIVNEWIQTKIEGYDVSGTVEHVGWWSPTIIRGEDREAVHIPNHQFTVNVVRNLSQKTHWRIKTHLAISHLDVSKINSIVADMRKVLAKNPQVEQQRLHRRVFLDNINPENQALLILVSCFVKTSHFEEYLCVKEAILLDLLRVISHHRARLATPIRTVQKVYTDADIDNIPFSETVYSRPRAANNRPFLLIEPSYRINGDDKSRSQVRPTRKSEEPDGKATAAPSNTKSEEKAVETPPESKTESRVTGMSPDPLADSNVDAKVVSPPPLASDGLAKKNKLSEKVASGVALPKSNKTDSPPRKTMTSAQTKSELDATEDSLVGSTQEKPAVNSLDPSSAAKEDNVPPTLHTKQESEKMPVAATSPMSRPALQDNIVLGVALDSSKRTLPIEEGMAESITPEEEKELAACRNGSGSGSSTPVDKDKKDGQVAGGQWQKEQEK